MSRFRNSSRCSRTTPQTIPRTQVHLQGVEKELAHSPAVPFEALRSPWLRRGGEEEGGGGAEEGRRRGGEEEEGRGGGEGVEMQSRG